MNSRKTKPGPVRTDSDANGLSGKPNSPTRVDQEKFSCVQPPDDSNVNCPGANAGILVLLPTRKQAIDWHFYGELC